MIFSDMNYIEMEKLQSKQISIVKVAIKFINHLI